jgi:DNA-binding NtrC family response regulator
MESGDSRRRSRLLVVEPDEGARRALVERLSALGVVDEARDAGQAARLQAGVHYDWVVAGPPRAPSQPGAPLDCIAESPGMRAALERAMQVAAGPSTVLLTGETGTGKDVVAGLLHRLSPRVGGPFVKLSCSALPETLLESELFGHERGAFTGADRLRIGRFEQADGGTLFLDEIGEMSRATQVKLLRVLEEREFHRLGGLETLRTGARIVAATHVDLSEAVRQGRFREDLYFRLDVISIHLPPLRERAEDLEPLARHFLAEIARESGASEKRLRPAALERLRRRRWRGNVRELRNALERAFFLCDGDWIEVADLPEPSLGAAPSAFEVELPPEGISLQAVERELVLRALEQADFVQKRAAELLRISRRKLNYMIRRMGVTHPSWRRNRGSGEAAAPTEPGGASDV